MTALAKCKDCRAITLDTEEDARAHREWHRDLEQKLRNTRSAAVEARDALAGLREDVRGVREELQAQPAPIEPDEITVTDMPDDDALGLHDPDEQTSQYTAEADHDAAGFTPDPDPDGDPAEPDEPDLAATQPLGRDPLREYFTSPTSTR